jgi:hypothetical protein
VSSAVIFINHFFIGSLEGMTANIRIRHRDRNPSNSAQLLNITLVNFMANAEQGLPFRELIIDENAISRKYAVLCSLSRRKWPVWWLFVRKYSAVAKQGNVAKLSNITFLIFIPSALSKHDHDHRI